MLTGRAKDMIVLSNGENIEPQRIEDRLLEKCSLIDQVSDEVGGPKGMSLLAILLISTYSLAVHTR